MTTPAEDNRFSPNRKFSWRYISLDVGPLGKQAGRSPPPHVIFKELFGSQGVYRCKFEFFPPTSFAHFGAFSFFFCIHVSLLPVIAFWLVASLLTSLWVSLDCKPNGLSSSTVHSDQLNHHLKTTRICI